MTVITRVRSVITRGALIGGFAGASTLMAQRTTVAHRDADDARALQELLARPVTLHLTKLSLQQAVDSVSRTANVIIQYQVPLLSARQTLVTLDARALPLGIALERILDGTGLRVASNGQGDLTIVAGADTRNSVAVGAIAGRVVDSATGGGLDGATVRITGTKRSVVTQDGGRFTLRDVPAGAQHLSVKMFGRHPVDRVVDVRPNETASLRIALGTVVNVLADVVTTATGEQSRRQLGNDIAIVNADSVMKVAPVRTVTDLLETRVPGLVVQRTSGAPGAPSRIRLRGPGGGLLQNGQGASNDPIVIVDGIRIYASQSAARDQNLAPATGAIGAASPNYPPPSALDQIDPNSIDKIEVFKGPSASAMYGSDAANGVIVITTKRGRPGRPHVDVTLGQSVDFMPGVYAPDATYWFGYNYYGLFDRQCTVIEYQCHVDSVVRYQALRDKRFSVIGRGGRSDGSATVSGGTEQVTYSITASASQTLGLFRLPDLYKDLYRTLYGADAPKWMQHPSKYSSWGAKGIFTVQPRTGLRATFATSLDDGSQLQTSGQGQLASLAGTYFDSTRITPTALGEYANKVTSHTVTSNNSAAVDWGWRNVPLSAQVGVNTVDRTDRSIIPYGVYGPANGGCGVGSDTAGCYATGHGVSRTQTANVNARLFPNYWVVTSVGLNVNRQSTEDFQGAVFPLQPGIETPSSFLYAGQQSAALTTAGWFVEPNFNFNSRFFVLPGYRIDGGSASGSHGGVNGGLFALFPKLQLSWIALDREGSSPLLGVFTFFRPRFAVGVAGVQPDPTWKLRLASTAPASSSPGLVVTTLGNTQIHPERSREFEGGFEAELWGQGLTLTATYYNKLRTDAISQVTVAPSVYGGGQYYINIGKVRNTGVELNARANLIQTPTVAWQVNVSYSSNTNRLLTLNGRQPYIDLGDGTRLAPGYPLNSRWVKPILGARAPGPGGRIVPSDLLIGDSAVYVGQEFPKYTLPMSTSLSFFRGILSVNATVSYENGLTQLNAGGAAQLAQTLADSTIPVGQQAAALAAATGLTQYGLIQTVNTLRFSALSLNYQVPTTLSRRFRVPRMTVALQGSNLGLWTNYRGKDPNVNAFTLGDKTQDNGQLPLPRTVGLRLSFGN